ncbi:nucleotidyl transferase AbiEii/AbiGii toxin family protein [Rhizobium sp. C4]|nr:nucleotidyl transferase AbiEii/AbiGii toxin family protein [Rhizobium sp. C4]
MLTHGEYRRSLDVDFLCADTDGYRNIRNAVFDQGLAALFADDVKSLRDIRADAYGIRTLVEYEGLAIKFEIVREARVSLSGAIAPGLAVPMLSIPDMFAEKLLANADRCFDRAVAYRDAIDLGRLAQVHHDIPRKAVEKAEAAYGADIVRKAVGILNHLQDASEVAYAAEALDMELTIAEAAIDAFREAARRAWPDADSL